MAAIQNDDGKRHRLPQRQGVPGGNPIRWLIVGGVLLIAAIMIGTTIMAGNFRERALDNSKRELENTVLLLARHFDQQLEDFGAVQNDLIAYMRASGDRHSRNISSGGCRARDIHLMLSSKLSAMSYVGGINIFDADGDADQLLLGLAGSVGQRRRPALFQGLQESIRNRPA